MFERRHEPLLPMPQFVARVGRVLGIALAVDALALVVGGLGFRVFEDLHAFHATLPDEESRP